MCVHFFPSRFLLFAVFKLQIDSHFRKFIHVDIDARGKLEELITKYGKVGGSGLEDALKGLKRITDRKSPLAYGKIVRVIISHWLPAVLCACSYRQIRRACSPASALSARPGDCQGVRMVILYRNRPIRANFRTPKLSDSTARFSHFLRPHLEAPPLPS
jgi:hypothetical protein